MQTLPGVMFDRESIRVLIENERPAVYWLYDANNELVYFGASMNLRTRLLAHVRDPRRKRATHVRIQWCRNTTQMARLEQEEQDRIAALTGGNVAELCGVVRRNPNWRAQNRKVASHA